MNLRLLLIVLLFPGFASAQFLPANTPLQQAYIQATQDDKLIFVLVESAGCQQCNDVADKGIENDPVQNQLKQHFVALRISSFHPDLDYIKEKYNYNGSGGNNVLFIDKWGTLVHRMNMSSTDPKKYLQEMANAMVKKGEADQVRSLEQAALTGSIDNDKLYALMLSRKQVSLPTDALLDKYVSQLPADSLKSVTTLQRIYRMCPVLNSSADQVLRQNLPLFRLAWMSLPKTEQTAIQQRIIFKTRQQAIQEKQLAKALLAADFARSTVPNKVGGDKAYQYNLMEYYRGIQDTASYLNACVEYYEKYLMKANAAEVKKMDSTWFANYSKNLVAHGDTIRDSQNRLIIKGKYNLSAIANGYEQDLNYGARSIYMMTNDTVYLKKALEWTAHASDFIENPYGLDTWARLLYKVDKNAKQAIQLEEKAISLSKAKGFHTERFNMVLNKMKQGLPNID
jgi:hypothetical protein